MKATVTYKTRQGVQGVQEVRINREAFGEGYSATALALWGCGKTSSTPKGAVHALVQDMATILSIELDEPEAAHQATSELVRTENARKVFYSVGDVRAVVGKRPNEFGEWVAVLQYKGQTLPDSEAFESDSESAHGTAQALALHLAHRVRMGQFPN